MKGPLLDYSEGTKEKRGSLYLQWSANAGLSQQCEKEEHRIPAQLKQRQAEQTIPRVTTMKQRQREQHLLLCAAL